MDIPLRTIHYCVGCAASDEKSREDEVFKRCKHYGEFDYVSISIVDYQPSDWVSLDVARCFESLPDKIPLLDGDELVIIASDIRILYDFPLATPVVFGYSSPNGFTRKDLVELIVHEYRKMYRDFVSTQSIAQTAFDPENKLSAVDSTNAMPSIRYHDLDELYIARIQYDARTRLVSLVVTN